MLSELSDLSFDGIAAVNIAGLTRQVRAEFPDLNLQENTVRHWVSQWKASTGK